MSKYIDMNYIYILLVIHFFTTAKLGDIFTYVIFKRYEQMLNSHRFLVHTGTSDIKYNRNSILISDMSAGLWKCALRRSIVWWYVAVKLCNRVTNLCLLSGSGAVLTDVVIFPRGSWLLRRQMRKISM